MNCIVQKFLDESTRKERIPVCLVDATNAEQTITVMKSITNMMKGIGMSNLNNAPVDTNERNQMIFDHLISFICVN